MEPNGHQGVCGVLLKLGVAEQPYQGRLGTGLLQPTQRDRRRSAILRIVIFEHAEQMLGEISVPQRLLHVGIQAGAFGGRPLLDTRDGADRLVADRRVGVGQARDDVRQDAAIGHRGESLERGNGKQRLLEQLDHRRHGSEVADLAQRSDRGVL